MTSIVQLQAHQAHIALSELMTSIICQGSSLGSCPTFSFPNAPLKADLRVIDFVSSSVWKEAETNIADSINFQLALRSGFFAWLSGIHTVRCISLSMADLRPNGPQLQLSYLQVGKLHHCITLEPVVHFKL